MFEFIDENSSHCQLTKIISSWLVLGFLEVGAQGEGSNHANDQDHGENDGDVGSGSDASGKSLDSTSDTVLGWWAFANVQGKVVLASLAVSSAVVG